MGSEPDYDPSSTPKLSLFSLPSSCKLHVPSSSPGMLTPPIHTSASVPFNWEEVPGKPRPCMVTQSKPKTARCLELPPRLLNIEAKVSNMPSPTTVLDGPYNNSYVGLSLSRSLSAGKGGSLTSLEKMESKQKSVFGSSRWGGFRKNKEVVDASDEGDTKVKITRMRRRSSFLHFPHSRSQLWTNMYETFKQVVPWRRRQEEKLRRKSSS